MEENKETILFCFVDVQIPYTKISDDKSRKFTNTKKIYGLSELGTMELTRSVHWGNEQIPEYASNGTLKIFSDPSKKFFIKYTKKYLLDKLKKKLNFLEFR